MYYDVRATIEVAITVKADSLEEAIRIAKEDAHPYDFEECFGAKQNWQGEQTCKPLAGNAFNEEFEEWQNEPDDDEEQD